MLYNIFVSFTGFDICLAKTYNNITEIARCLGTSSSSLKPYLRCKMAVTSIKMLWLFLQNNKKRRPSVVSFLNII